MFQDIRILRYKTMRLPFIKQVTVVMSHRCNHRLLVDTDTCKSVAASAHMQVEAAWLIHGGKEVILRHRAVDKWTGNMKTFTLEVCLQSLHGSSMHPEHIRCPLHFFGTAAPHVSQLD